MNVGQRLARGEVVALANKLYCVCRLCGKPVQLNKRFVGSMHICEPYEERTR